MTTGSGIDDLISQAWKFAQEYMSQPWFDNSHDFSHLQRVVSLAHMIYDSSTPQFQSSCDRSIITLLALLHDIGDRKYAMVTPDTVGKGEVETFLLSLNVSKDFASLIQHLVSNVSFSNEQKNKEYVQNLATRYPELAVVQDADRLDAIGAIGIARVITYGSLKQPQLGWQGIIDHYHERLRDLASKMKTVEGKKLAQGRGERMRVFFEEWWNNEYPMMPAPIVLRSPVVSTEGKYLGREISLLKGEDKRNGRCNGVSRCPATGTEGDMAISLPDDNDLDAELEDQRNGNNNGSRTDPF